ncbi:MAG: hypothetical protein MUF42_04440 [Cytophagaceae bacterium]|jgi:hypothetical protein|nr:hypothetical protein [Cytophagaceae bacterium]
MKHFLLSLLLSLASVAAYAQSAPTFDQCQNDSTFFRLVSARPMPVITCDTVFLITKQHRLRLSTEKFRQQEVQNSLKREIDLYKQQATSMQELSNRHKQHVDSLQLYISEKDKQLVEMKALVDRATENTDRCLKLAKRNRRLAIGGGVLSGVLAILLLLK